MTTPEERLAAAASKFESGNGEALAITQDAIARLAYRRRHSGKNCSGCHCDLPLSAFGPDGGRPDGLSHRCRSCDNTRKRKTRTHVS